MTAFTTWKRPRAVRLATRSIAWKWTFPNSISANFYAATITKALISIFNIASRTTPIPAYSVPIVTLFRASFLAVSTLPSALWPPAVVAANVTRFNSALRGAPIGAEVVAVIAFFKEIQETVSAIEACYWWEKN
jgi:hypothetical protein